MKILLTAPDFDRPHVGGVETYYMKVRACSQFSSEHFIIGQRSNDARIIKKAIRLVKDYWRFAKNITKENYDCIVVNPSLEARSSLRDCLFVLLAQCMNNRTVIFIHGWDTSFEQQIGRFGIRPFRMIFGRAGAIVVLANEFREKLREWGLSNPIFVESTAVEEATIARPCRGIVEGAAVSKRNCRILFMSRLVKTKGIYQAIEAFRLVKMEWPGATLVIAGDGPELDPAKAYVEGQGIQGIKFPGYVSGEEKLATFAEADVFLLPTEHGEGMPNVILEAMGCGLPVVTRLVGGTKDFFENGEMGFATDSIEPAVFAEFLKTLIDDSALRASMGAYNNAYAQKYFLAPKVAARLNSICLSVADTNRNNIPRAWYEHG